MEFTLITSENFKPACWSGGTTTELFIFPPTADFHQRNFQFRLSTATVETDKSDFTPLNGISRKLLVLAGEITLIHDGHYSRKLNKFDVDEFDGRWKTSSVGKCIDFNLMTAGKTSGEIKVANIEKGQHFTCKIKENCDWFFIYLFSGKVSIDLDKKTVIINKGDLLVINVLTTRNIEISGAENSELVFIEINL
jgi:uncharacterized protein